MKLCDSIPHVTGHSAAGYSFDLHQQLRSIKYAHVQVSPPCTCDVKMRKNDGPPKNNKSKQRN